MVFPTISAWQNSKTDWSVVRRRNAEHKPQAALTTSKTLSFQLTSHSSCSLMALFRSHFTWLVCMAQFALCMSSTSLLFYMYSRFPKYTPVPWACVSHSSFHHSLCLAVRCLMLIFQWWWWWKSIWPCPSSTLLPPFYTHYSSGTAQELLDAEPKVTFISQQHLALLTLSSFVRSNAFPGSVTVLLMFFWSLCTPKFNYFLGISIWRALHYFHDAKFLNGVHKALCIWPLFIFPTPSIMIPLAPQAPGIMGYFRIMAYAMLSLDPVITLALCLLDIYSFLDLTSSRSNVAIPVWLFLRWTICGIF